MAVVIVIGAGQVQDIDLRVETRRRRVVIEGSVTTIQEQGSAAVHVDRRQEQVGKVIAVEVVEDAAAGQVGPAQSQPHSRSDVLEPPDVERRAKTVQRQKVLARHLVRVFAQRHVGQVEQPAEAKVPRHLLEIGRELLDRLA
jgi:hypothetical protein